MKAFNLPPKIFLVLFFLVLSATAARALIITAATGGGSIPADNAANSPAPAWTSLGQIVLNEQNTGASGDINSGTLILEAPAGFEFNTSQVPSITFQGGRNIISATIEVTDATTLTITLVVSGTTSRDTLTIGSNTPLQVRPVAGTPLASGVIHRPASNPGTAVINGITPTADPSGAGGTSLGTLTEVAGAADNLVLQTAPSATATVGTPFSTQPVIWVTDHFGNRRTADNSTVVQAAVLSGAAPLQGTTNDTVAAGIAAFSDLSYNIAAGISLLFTSDPLAPINSPEIVVYPANNLFYDGFSRGTDPGPLDPWILQSGVWSATGGRMKAGTNASGSYGLVRITNTWSDCVVQANLQFPSGGYGGGVAARLNPATGARYAAWVYPENSTGGSSMMKLVKFQNWTSFGYSNVASVPMGTVALPSVGTNVHNLKLAVQGNLIAVHFDGVRLLSMQDQEAQPYTSGAVALEQYTDAVGFTTLFHDLFVSAVTPPDANNDSYTTSFGFTLTVPAPGVLANDLSDVGALTALLATSPAHGTLTLSTNGGFVFTPTAGYVGLDSFTYRASSGVATSAPANVTITVTPNNAPVANADSFSAYSGAALIIPAPGVLANDTDVEGQALTAVLATPPTKGTVSLSTNGGFTYTSVPGQVGTDSFTYRANDGLNNSSPATVTINLSQPASLFTENFARTNEPGTLAPWVAVDGNWSITAGLLRGGTNALSSYGHIIMSSNWTDYAVQARVRFPSNGFGAGISGRVNPSTGQRYAAWIFPEASPGGSNVLKLFKFQSWVGYGYTGSVYVAMKQVSLPAVGTDWHTLKLAMQGDEVGVHFDGVRLICVTDVEAQPLVSGGIGLEMWTDTTSYSVLFEDVTVTLPTVPVATNDSYTVTTGVPFTVPARGVLTNDSAFAGELRAIQASNPTRGTLSLSTNGGFTYTASGSTAGSDSFTYRATDGFATSATATVSFTIQANAGPTGVADSYSAWAGAALIVPAPGVLANDSDPNGQPLRANLVSGPANGLLSLSTNGGFNYMPRSGFTGADSFVYRASDGILNSALTTVSISVNSADPLFLEDFTDPSLVPPWVTQAGTWSVTGGVLRGGTNTLSTYAYTYVPTNYSDFTLQAQVRFLNGGYGGGIAGRIDPGSGARYAAWVYPEGSPGGSSIVKLFKFQTWNAFGYNGAAVPMAQASLPGVGTGWHTLKLAFLGSRIAVHYDSQRVINIIDSEAAGPYLMGGIGAEFWTDTVGYRFEVDSMQVTLPVPPVATNDGPYVAHSGVPLTIPAPGVLTNDFTEVDNLLALQVSAPANGVLTLGTSGGFTYTPNIGYTGPDAFTYRATDGAATTAVATVSFNVEANTSPVAANDFYSAVAGSTLTVPAPGVMVNDIDPDGQPIQVLPGSGVSHGSLNLSTNGSFTYTPQAGYTGSDGFTYRVRDGVLTSAVASVSISINGPGTLFSDNFTRGSDPAALTSPWIAGAGLWSVTGGALAAGTNGTTTYGIAYLPTNWSDYAVQAKVRFPNGGYGGGIGGRLNPFTGARYAAWLYPDSSPGGSNVLKLLKFQNWNAFGYSNVVLAPMRQVAVGPVGTISHTLGLVFDGSTISVSLDGNQLISMVDTEPDAYLVGGVTAEMWTAATGYTMTFDDLQISIPGPSTTPVILGIVANPNNTVSMQFQGMPTTQYIVQAATNCGAPVWTSISTNTSDASGKWSYSETRSRPIRFYRAAKP